MNGHEICQCLVFGRRPGTFHQVGIENLSNSISATQNMNMKCSLLFAIYEGTVHQFDPQSSLRLASSSFLDCLEQVSSTTNLHFHSSDLCQNCDGRIEAAKVPQNPVGCSFLCLLLDQGHKYSCFLSLQYDCHTRIRRSYRTRLQPISVAIRCCSQPLLLPRINCSSCVTDASNECVQHVST